MTLKSNMAAFDLCRGTAKISNNFAQYSSMCMYSADFSYTEVLMIAESNYDTFFHLRIHFTSQSKMADFDLCEVPRRIEKPDLLRGFGGRIVTLNSFKETFYPQIQYGGH